MNKPYQLTVEIAGPVALWARPDTMPNPVSYVAPTSSAVKGIFEAILRWKNVAVRPIMCEICSPVQFHRYAFNYGGPLRKADQIKKGTSLQLFTQVLINVCYRLHAEVDWFRGPTNERVDSPNDTCSPHAYMEVFHRRLERGRWFYTPCLGWKEFVPNYLGPFRKNTTPCLTENHIISAFLEMIFDQPQYGARGRETYLRNVIVTNGRLEYKHGETGNAE